MQLFFYRIGELRTVFHSPHVIAVYSSNFLRSNLKSYNYHHRPNVEWSLPLVLCFQHKINLHVFRVFFCFCFSYILFHVRNFNPYLGHEIGPLPTHSYIYLCGNLSLCKKQSLSSEAELVAGVRSSHWLTHHFFFLLLSLPNSLHNKKKKKSQKEWRHEMLAVDTVTVLPPSSRTAYAHTP